jgi:hypothetical protein
MRSRNTWWAWKYSIAERISIPASIPLCASKLGAYQVFLERVARTGQRLIHREDQKPCHS